MSQFESEFESVESYDPLDFSEILRISASRLPKIARTLLPDGEWIGHEWIAPVRGGAPYDIRSLKIDLYSGKWADFATEAWGDDVVSLVAYLKDTTKAEAAKLVWRMI